MEDKDVEVEISVKFKVKLKPVGWLPIPPDELSELESSDDYDRVRKAALEKCSLAEFVYHVRSALESDQTVLQELIEDNDLPDAEYHVILVPTSE